MYVAPVQAGVDYDESLPEELGGRTGVSLPSSDSIQETSDSRLL